MGSYLSSSTTRTVIVGMSNSCRRMILAGGPAAATRIPQPPQAPGSPPHRAARPAAGCAPPAPAAHPACARTSRAATSAPACPARRSTAASTSRGEAASCRSNSAVRASCSAIRPSCSTTGPTAGRSPAPEPPRAPPATRRTERSLTNPPHPGGLTRSRHGTRRSPPTSSTRQLTDSDAALTHARRWSAGGPAATRRSAARSAAARAAGSASLHRPLCRSGPARAVR